jgi:hypothetical protein
VRFFYRQMLRVCVQATRLCVTLFVRDGRSNTRPIGWVNCQLFDYRDRMLTGPLSLCMWPNGPANPIGTCRVVSCCVSCVVCRVVLFTLVCC